MPYRKTFRHRMRGAGTPRSRIPTPKRAVSARRDKYRTTSPKKSPKKKSPKKSPRKSPPKRRPRPPSRRRSPGKHHRRKHKKKSPPKKRTSSRRPMTPESSARINRLATPKKRKSPPRAMKPFERPRPSSRKEVRPFSPSLGFREESRGVSQIRDISKVRNKRISRESGGRDFLSGSRNYDATGNKPYFS